MGFEIELCLLLSGNLHAGCVVGGIKISTTAQASFRTRRADVLQHRFVIDQGLSSPIPRDVTEHTMFDRVPFRGAGRQVSYGNRQVKLVCQLLQAVLPQPATIPIGATTVSFNQQVFLARIDAPSQVQPPFTDGGDGEGPVSYTHLTLPTTPYV